MEDLKLAGKMFVKTFCFVFILLLWFVILFKLVDYSICLWDYSKYTIVVTAPFVVAYAWTTLVFLGEKEII